MEDKDIKIIDDETKEKIKKQVNDTKEKSLNGLRVVLAKLNPKTAGLLTVVTAVITFIVAYNGVKNILFNVALYNPVKGLASCWLWIVAIIVLGWFLGEVLEHCKEMDSISIALFGRRLPKAAKGFKATGTFFNVISWISAIFGLISTYQTYGFGWVLLLGLDSAVTGWFISIALKLIASLLDDSLFKKE